MTGSQWVYLTVSSVLIILTWIYCFLAVIPPLNHINYTLKYIASLLCFIHLASFVNTAFTDPGIIPRTLASSPEWLEECLVAPSYCNICAMTRPPRARHCRHCDNCVMVCFVRPILHSHYRQTFDHHCPWIGNCVGLRNYRQYFIFLISSAVSSLLILSCSVVLFVQWYLVAHSQFMWFRCIVIPIVSIWLLMVVISLVSLITFHLRLIFIRKTTNEFLKPNKLEETESGPMHKRSYFILLPTLLPPLWEELEIGSST